MQNLPLFFNVRGKKLLIVGNGHDAMQRLGLLANTQAKIAVIASHPQMQLVQLAHSHAHVKLHKRAWQDSDFDEACMLFLAPETPCEHATAANITAQARTRHIPVNTMDNKTLCDFYVPAIVNREPIVVAIGSEGTSPLLTTDVKATIEQTLPARIGFLAAYAGSLRQRIQKTLAPHQRKSFWRRFLDSSEARHSMHVPMPKYMLAHAANTALDATTKDSNLTQQPNEKVA